MSARVFVTQPIPDAGLKLIKEHATVELGPADRGLTRDELAESVRGVDGIVCFVADPIDTTVLSAAAPTCRVVASYGVGTDNIDLAAATRLGIQVTNTPDVLTDATGDLAFALLLAVARQLPAAMAYARSGEWPGIRPMQIFGCDVAGKTLGIVGPGRIGQAMARRGRGFDMPIVYCGRGPCPPLSEMGGRQAALADVLAESDFISLHVPLTPETRSMIGAAELARMKPTAFLINTARGAIVDEAALIAALSAGRIAGAGLDVFAEEPAIPQVLLQMPNVICLPHVGSATQETRSRMGVVAAQNLLACLRGVAPPNPVNHIPTKGRIL